VATIRHMELAEGDSFRQRINLDIVKRVVEASEVEFIRDPNYRPGFCLKAPFK